MQNLNVLEEDKHICSISLEPLIPFFGTFFERIWLVNVLFSLNGSQYNHLVFEELEPE